MTRLIPHRDMTADEILRCSYQAQGMLATCVLALDGLNEGNVSATAADIALTLNAALELLGPVHDALERNEGMEGKK